MNAPTKVTESFQIDLAEGTLTLRGVTTPVHTIDFQLGHWSFIFDIQAERNTDGVWAVSSSPEEAPPMERPQMPRSLEGTFTLDPATCDITVTVDGKPAWVGGHHLTEFKGKLNAWCFIHVRYANGKIVPAPDTEPVRLAPRLQGAK